VAYKYSEVRRLDQLKEHTNVEDKPGIYLFLSGINAPVLYVGRSDKSLRRRIKNRGYPYYIFIHCDTVHEAYGLSACFTISITQAITEFILQRQEL
jgi:hypothetical protein